jgi:hypothetical protein
MRAQTIVVLFGASICGCSEAENSTMAITIDPVEVPPGVESQKCHYLKAGTNTDLDIARVSVDFGRGTHHIQVYYGDSERADGVEDCFQAVDFEKWHLLVASQRERIDWQLPEGVAFRIKAHQQLLVQVHFVNVTLLKTDGNSGGTIRFERARQAVRHHMGSIFGQQRNIDIKPHSSATVFGICRLPERDLKLAALAGHYHFRGRDFIAYRMAHGAADGQEFYRTDVFAEPKFEMYSEPMSFPVGERILWRCDYDNPDPLEIGFGPREVDQEHCNMFAFYYPAAAPQEFTPCVSFDRCTAPCPDAMRCDAHGECVEEGARAR